MRTVAAAIARSISHNEIVTLRGTRSGYVIESDDRVSDVCDELYRLSDGDAEDGPVREFWGTEEDDDGNDNEWRVHVRRYTEPSDD